MLIIVCGEDNLASRNYYLSLQEEYKAKQYDVTQIAASEIATLLSEAATSPNLFGNLSVYLTENLNKTLSRKKGNTSLSILEKIQEEKEIVLIDWEDGVQARELKSEKLGTVEEFKPDTSIFKLLDLCYPAKMREFLISLTQICTPQNEMFIYLMILRHMRNVLMLSAKAPLPQLQGWQIGKLKAQADKWESGRLASFYEKLVAIEISLKSGANPYGIKKSLEILSCYYL